MNQMIHRHIIFRVYSSKSFSHKFKAFHTHILSHLSGTWEQRWEGAQIILPRSGRQLQQSFKQNAHEKQFCFLGSFI